MNKKDIFDRNGHSKNRMRYHMIFSTKYRRRSLKDIEESVYDAFRHAEASGDYKIVTMGVDKGDHIHLVLKFKPSLSADQVARHLKQLTTDYLWKTNSDHLRKFYWKKNKRLLWADGYFVSTIGVVSEERVLNYVRKQAN